MDPNRYPPLSEGERKCISEVITPARLGYFASRFAPAGSDRRTNTPGNRRTLRKLKEDIEDLGPKLRLRSISTPDADGVPFESVEASLPDRQRAGGPVLVVAHADATSEVGRAPGRDDNASGMSALLLVARAHELLDRGLRTPRRELRYLWVNGEEQSMLGSMAYARAEHDAGTAFEAVINVDMIGHESDGDPVFEIHAWCEDEVTRERSHQLAKFMWAMTSGTRLKPQTLGLIHNWHFSDHLSFMEFGYPACAITEDMTRGVHDTGDANPAKHASRDTRINAEYAASIAQFVASATWMLATRNRFTPLFPESPLV